MNKGYSMMGLVVLASLACAYGWIANIAELVTEFDVMTTGEAVARGVGILFAPVGIVMGYM